MDDILKQILIIEKEFTNIFMHKVEFDIMMAICIWLLILW